MSQQTAPSSTRVTSQNSASHVKVQKPQPDVPIKKSVSGGTSPNSSSRYNQQHYQQQPPHQKYMVPRTDTSLAVLRILQFQEAIAAADSSSTIEYWRGIANEFFQQNVLFWVSMGPNRFCVPYNAIGRFFHCFYQEGVQKMNVLVENPRQYATLSSSALVDITSVHLIMHYADQTEVFVSAAIRALVAPTMKFEWLQIELLSHTEMIPKSVHETPKMKPDDRNFQSFGITSGMVTFLELADVFFHMQEVIAAVQSSSGSNPGGIVGTFRMLVDPMQTNKRPVSPLPTKNRKNSSSSSPRAPVGIKKLRMKNETAVHHVSPKHHRKKDN